MSTQESQWLDESDEDMNSRQFKTDRTTRGLANELTVLLVRTRSAHHEIA